MSPDPHFSTEQNGGRPLVVCMIGQHRGTARIHSDGEDKARERAEAQALALWRKANGL